MNGNSNLNAAKTAKNDEFYTYLEDVEKEMEHYKDQFEGKIVHCNCDDPSASKFHEYFKTNFDELKLKKLITTGFSVNQETWMQPVGETFDGTETETLHLINSDFRSMEIIDLMKEADYVITNPPFSLFREYVEVMIMNGQKFCILGNMNACKYAEIFPLFLMNEIWYGAGKSGSKSYWTPKGKPELKLGNSCWFTNMKHDSLNEPLNLTAEYDPAIHLPYANSDGINVDKTKDIPMDYDGTMGVPISYLDKHCPEQFKIIGLNRQPRIETEDGGMNLYTRILIKKIKS